MNNLALLIASAFDIQEPRLLSSTETFDYFEARVSFDNEPGYNQSQMPTYINEIIKRDKVKLDFYMFEGDDAKSIVLNTDNCPDKIDAIQDYYKDLENDKAKTSPYFLLTINKTIDRNQIPLFDEELFVEFFDKSRITHTLETLFKYLEEFSHIQFITPPHFVSIETQSMSFGPERTITSPHRQTERIEKCKELCNFLNLNSFDLLPEDFVLTKRSGTKADKAFDRLAAVFLGGYLFNQLRFDTNLRADYNLVGYKSQMGRADPDVPMSISEYSRIYEWVYGEGNFSDKLGLARNVISLNIQTTNNPYLISENTFYAIRSNHDLYLRENVKMYIETKNKLNDYISESANKGAIIADNFAGSFKQSAFSFLSFFLSVIVFKLLKGDRIVSLFAGEIKKLSLLIVAVALFVFAISLWEVIQKKNRFIFAYNEFKKSYSTLFDPDDLESLFNSDRQHNKDLNFINTKIILYSILWLTSLCSVVAMVVILSN